MKKKNLNEETPQIYCAISIMFNDTIDVDKVREQLKDIGILEIIVHRPKCESVVSMDIAIIDNEYFWYLDDALTKMFSKIDNIIQLKKIVKRYNGTICIDIAFYHYGTYPALEIIGRNMELIRFLEADISIDAY